MTKPTAARASKWEMSNTRAVRPRVLRRHQFAYAGSFLGTHLLWQAFNTVALYDYVTVHGVPGTELSIILTVFGILSGVLNPIIGSISDRTRTRFGRRIPYIAVGSLPLCLLFVAAFDPPKWGALGLVLYFSITTLLFYLFYVTVTLTSSALLPEMYNQYKTRAFVASLQQVSGMLGLFIGVALSKSLAEWIGWMPMALCFAVLALVTLYGSLYGSFEPKGGVADEARAPSAPVRGALKDAYFRLYAVANAIIQLTTTLFVTASPFYTRYVVLLSAKESATFLGSIFIVSIPMSFVWSRLVSRMSLTAAASLAALAYMILAAAFLVDRTPLTVILTGAALGVPIAGFMVVLNLLLADVVDEDEQRCGRRREGAFFGMNGLIVCVGVSLQFAILAVFFAASGYHANAVVQSPQAAFGLRLLIGGLPIPLLAAALLLLGKCARFRSAPERRRSA